MTQRVNCDSGSEVQVFPPSGVPNPQSFPVGQNEWCSHIDWKYILAIPAEGLLVFLGVRKAGVQGLQVFCARSLRGCQGRTGCRFVEIVTHTEACDDKQRMYDREECFITGRKLANIVVGRDNFEGGDGMKIDSVSSDAVST